MRTTFFLLALLFTSIAGAQTTVVLQPDSCDGKDAVVASCIPCGFHNTNYGETNELSAIAWTASGTTSLVRALMQFNLSEIPLNATVSSAKLSLYHNPTGSNPGHSQLSGSNEAYLMRVTSDWSESNVTWDNQPTTTSQDQVVFPASLNDTQDYLDLDVTALVQQMVDDPSQNFGFMLQLQNESYYRSLLFASSDHADPLLHPKLEITYVSNSPNPDFCLSLQPGNTECSQGKDAVVASCIPCGFNAINYGDVDEFSSIAWTASGALSLVRGLLDFDLSSVPTDATVTSSSLSLYHNPSASSGNPGHSQLSGSNEAVLQRIIAAWDESTVTWDNQPATTTQNEVMLSASLNDTLDYLDIDVTALVQEMVSTPSENFGFMLRLQSEAYYRSLLFASSDHPDPSLWPKLDICYSTTTTGSISHGNADNNLQVYPNPAANSFFIGLSEPIDNAELIIHDVLGNIIMNRQFNGNRLSIDASELASGIYLVSVRTIHSIHTERLIVK